MSVESRRAQRKGETVERTETQKILDAEKTKQRLGQATDVVTDFIPGVSETKDIISLGQNIGKGQYLAAGADAVALGLGAVPVAGDIARRAFKTLANKFIKTKKVDPTVSSQDALKLSESDIDNWKVKNQTSSEFQKKLKGRSDTLQGMAQGLKDKVITKKEYREAADAIRPIKTVKDVPKPASFKDTLSALDSRQRKNPIVGVNYNIPEGDKISARLDITAYTQYDTWIPTLKHEGKTMYKPSVVLKDVTFIKPEASQVGKALNVATGKPKAPFAVMEGKYVDADNDSTFKYAKKIFKDKDVIQIGYDPTRRGFFYDRKTGNPVLEADEVVQVGHLVLAKKAKIGNPDDFFYSKGGDVMDKDIEMGVLPKARPEYLKRAYDMADTEVMGYNASLLELKTNPERALQNEKNMFYPPSRFEGDEEVLKLVDKIRGENIPFSREDMEKNPRVGFKEGGMPKQMEMFEDGGLKDEGGEVDEESGNEVPPGSTKEEVRDDIPARLSEGEFVFPADVVRYLGLDFLMRLRQKAKAGLQRMEEMGQMGNSDEATLPDDIPFTIEDLEMEDDPVEMQVGGVVTNPLGNPTNMPNQVTTMNQPNVYNPSMGQMYTPGGVTPYAPATFKSLLPQSSTGQVKTENRKYVKGSQVRFVPFIVGTGQPLNPAQLAQLEADGFKLDTGTISPTEKTKVETTKVQPTDTSSGDDSGTTSTLGATLAIGGDKDTDRPGLQKNSTTFEIGYNVPGRLPGIASIAALPGILGGKAPEGTTVDFKKGNITKTVSYEDFLKIKNDVTGQFAKDFVSRVNDLEKLNKNQIVFDPQVGYKDTVKDEVLTYEQITDPRDGLGKDIADRLEKETRDRSFLGFDVSTSATDAYNKLSDSEKSAYNDYVTESEEQEETRDTGFTSTAPSLSDIGRDDDTPDDDAPDDDSSAGTSVSDASEDPAAGFDFNQGGLLKRKPKVKKMKRGGLASR